MGTALAYSWSLPPVTVRFTVSDRLLGETTPVIPGTVIDLGDGATLTAREV